MSQSESQQIKNIKDRYKASFGEKIELLNHQRDILVADKAASEKLFEIIHKLAGSSGMYGYDDISDLCRHIMAEADNSDADEIEASMAKLVTLFEHYS
ncbi:MAG: chemotaxis protein histidine kinase CheA [Arenicella sp.]|jgi:chemotaxis protein histidine kinase CheA